MISLQRLQQAISESSKFGSVTPVERIQYQDWLEKSSENKLIKAVTGFRRSGKSFLLKMLSQSLLKKGVSLANIFYLNLENDLLSQIKTVQNLRSVWEVYLREIAVPGQPVFIIWDEVQLVAGWEKLVRALYEQGKYNIFISGSNSRLLSGELASSLSGRCLSLEVRPFSFREYLSYCRIKADYYYQNKQLIDQAFSVYLKRGGIAEQFDLQDPFVSNYQTGLVQKIILDDLVKRYLIENINVLKEVFDFVCGNITSIISLRKIVNRLNEQGLKVSAATIDNYLSYWQTAFAIERLPKFDYRLSRVFSRTAKYYSVDNLLIKGREEANEKRLENLVYLELSRRYGRENVWFGQDPNGYEIDFVIKLENKFKFFQVCLELNDKNAKREFGNLNLINKYVQGEGAVLYLDDVRSGTNAEGGVPVIEWLIM